MIFSFASPVADKGLSGKRTKTENSGEALAEVEDSNPQKTSATKNCVKNLSSHWLMKSEPESRLEKGVDVKVRSLTCLQSLHGGF